MPIIPSIESVAECLVSQANSDSEEAQERALQSLSSLTKVSTENRNLLAHTHGAVPTILSLSSSSSVHLQILSLSILLNLSLNPNLKRTLATTTTIQHLNSIILSPASLHSSMLAASLVCSLAMLDKNKAVFGVAGTIQVIVKALSNAGSSAAHHLLSSLFELSQFHGNCTLAVWAGAVPVLLGILDGPDEDDLSGSCLSVLSLLSRYEQGMQEIQASDGVVELLVDALKRRCMVSRENAAEILVRLFREDEKCMRDAVGKHDFSSLTADLSIRGSAKAREKATVLITMIMDFNLDYY